MFFTPSIVVSLHLIIIPHRAPEVGLRVVLRFLLHVQLGDQIFQTRVLFLQFLHDRALFFDDCQGFVGVGLPVRLQVPELALVLRQLVLRVLLLVLIIVIDF